MKDYTPNINKFNTYEMIKFYNTVFQTEYSVSINNLNFLNTSPNFKILKILSIITENNNISQSALAKKLDIAPSMINKYIKHLKKNNLILLEGKNNKNIKYYLTEKGKDFQEEYRFNFFNDILKLHKTIIVEIESCLNMLKTKKIIDLVLFGINEFAEIIIELTLKKKSGLNIKGLFDSDASKFAIPLYNFEIQPFEKYNLTFGKNVIICSLSHKNDIINYLKNNFDNDINLITINDLFKESNFI